MPETIEKTGRATANVRFVQVEKV